MSRVLSIGFSVLILLAAISGCEKVINDSDEVLIGPKGGRCKLNASGGTRQLCLYFSSGDANAAYNQCQEQATNRTLNLDWFAGDGNNCDATDGIGSCINGNLTVSYYSEAFNATSADADCTGTMGGSFVAP